MLRRLARPRRACPTTLLLVAIAGTSAGASADAAPAPAAELQPWTPQPGSSPSEASPAPSDAGPPSAAPGGPPPASSAPAASPPTRAPPAGASAAPTPSNATAATTPPPPDTTPEPYSGPARERRTEVPDPTTQGDEIPPIPVDPNDAPFMRPPNNQPLPVPPRTRPDLRRPWSAQRRLALTVAPAFASFRLGFQGPRPARVHGAGVNLELDARLIKWIWFRVQGTYSGHPVDEVRVVDDEEQVTVTAPGGTIHATGFGAGPVFALDIGRFLPLIEVGLGGQRVVTPRGIAAGQRGEQCRADDSCDVGLRCNAARVCQPGVIAELYFGAAVDVLVRKHLSFGAQFRYYALLRAPTAFPVYLIGALRVSIRF